MPSGRANKKTEHGISRFGRPPRPAELVRSERVVTFVTPAELAALQQLSGQWRTSLSGTVHRLTIRGLETATTPTNEPNGRTS